MSSEPANNSHLYFRGQERVDLVEDLARGSHTHAEIAEKYGRSLQGIRQFSARNHAEIVRRRRELQGELNAATVDRWVSNKAQLGDLYWKHYEDLEARISDPIIDARTLKALTREAVAIIHKYSELMGWLPSRTTLELDTAPTFRHSLILSRPEDSGLVGAPGDVVDDSAAERARPSVTAPTTAPTAPAPTPAPAPAPVSDPSITPEPVRPQDSMSVPPSTPRDPQYSPPREAPSMRWLG